MVDAVNAALPALLRVLVLSDGRAGHVSQSLGLAESFGRPEIRHVAPRALYAALAPFVGPDPRDLRVCSPPFPDIAIAAGRRTLPYLRELKRASQGRVFTVYLNRPATGERAADVIVAPRHDGFFARNVIAPATPPNQITPGMLARLRESPDPRIAALPAPRVALLIGGNSRHFRFTKRDATALATVAQSIAAQGASVIATTSRRTPRRVRAALMSALAHSPAFLWDGTGDNPYFSMLANADHIIVTADSVSMVGEAVATGAPAHVFAPAGGSRKIGVYLETLKGFGAARPWSGSLESWTYTPVNSTPLVAEQVQAAYLRFRQRLA